MESAKDHIIKGIASKYKSLAKSSPCAFGGFSTKEDEWFFRETTAPCHYRLKTSNEMGGYDQYLTSYLVYGEVELAWFDFMKNHLYRNYADYIHLEQDTKSGAYYILVSDTRKIPAPIFYNLSICSRVPVEFLVDLKRWYEIQKGGVNPGLAFLLTRCLRGGDGRIVQLPILNGHMWYDGTANVRRIMDGNPESSAPPWFSDPDGCTPCNVIWGVTQDMRTWIGKTYEEIITLYQPVEEIA